MFYNENQSCCPGHHRGGSRFRPQLNDLLHENSEHIIGRMGIPYRAKKINVMSVAVDAPQDVTAALTGKIGALPGIRVKTAYSQFESDE